MHVNVVFCAHGPPEPGAPRSEAAICQLTFGRHSNQNALRRVQSVPLQEELWEGTDMALSLHTLLLLLLVSLYVEALAVTA